MDGLACHLLELAGGASPAVRDSLRQYGDARLTDLLASLRCPDVTPLQARNDLWDVIGRQASSYYGAELAREAVAEVRADPMLPTSNHFGVDTFADSVQGTMLFALRPRPDGGTRRTVVVLGGGSVSLNGVTYPMGLQLYDPCHGDITSLPQRLPVFGKRYRRSTAGSVRPFDEPMVGRARARLHAMRRTGQVTAFCERAAGRILEEDFGAASTLSMPSYGHQATCVNTRLWRRMFPGRAVPRLVQLELEAVCGELIADDLRNPASLIHMVMFVPAVRDAVLARLDGARACWRRENLRQRLNGGITDLEARDGTVFFWGLTEDGRRIPLTLDGPAGAIRLAGIDERGRRWEWEFSAEGLAAGLGTRQLTPSLLTCYTALSFARGIVPVGGYYQAEYLPVMQRTVASAVRSEDPAAADLIARVPTGSCLAGLQFAIRVLPGGQGIPAGPVEMSGAGGITAADLASVPSVTVRESCRAALMEILPHLEPGAAPPGGWAESLATENAADCHSLIRLAA